MNEKTYLGTLCSLCGSNERYRLSHQCAPCKRAIALKYYRANREKVLPKMREYRNQDEDRQKRQRAYYLANKEYFLRKRRIQLARIKAAKANSVDKQYSEK